MKRSVLGMTVCMSAFMAFVPLQSFANKMEGKGTLSVKKVDKRDYPSMAKIDLPQAVNAALTQVPGKATQAELESKDNYLVYEVKIATSDKKMTEVYVDAGSGHILNVEKKG